MATPRDVGKRETHFVWDRKEIQKATPTFVGSSDPKVQGITLNIVRPNWTEKSKMMANEPSLENDRKHMYMKHVYMRKKRNLTIRNTYWSSNHPNVILRILCYKTGSGKSQMAATRPGNTWNAYISTSMWDRNEIQKAIYDNNSAKFGSNQIGGGVSRQWCNIVKTTTPVKRASFLFLRIAPW